MSLRRRTTRWSSHSGQSLIETALLLPLLLLLIFNVINFAYYFLVGIHLASAPREGVQYSAMGFSTPGQLTLPEVGPAGAAASVAYLTYQDMAALVDTNVGAQVRVCTSAAGTTVDGSGNHVARCVLCTSGSDTCSTGSGPFATPAVDPEGTAFVLHRVDVQYTVAPLIPGTVFGITVLPSYTFHRQVSMRAMN